MPSEISSEAEPDVIALVRAELGVALRFTLAIGLAIGLAMFAALASRMAIWQLVPPTGNHWTLAGLAVAFGLAVAVLVGLMQLRDLGLIAVSHRLARRLAAPLVLAAARREGRSDLAAGQALRDVEALRRSVTGNLLTGLADAVLVPVLVLLLLLFHWAFAAWALACCTLAALLSLLGERQARRALVAANAAQADTAGLVADAMRCAEAVEAMGLREALSARWQARQEQGAVALGAAQAGLRRMGAGLSVIQGAAAGGALAIGTLLLGQGAAIGFGMVVAMLVTGQTIAPFLRLGGALQEAGAARAAWQRLAALSDQQPAAPLLAFPCAEARLLLDRVSFAHPGASRALLREVTLEVTPGQLVALAGGAGSGKSTCLRIAIGMVRPSAGGCFLDGQTTAQWAREDFARHVGFLPQDPLLTDGTVAEAIARLGVPDMPAVLRAAQLAGAHDLITALPAGYATPIRAEGPLSAGQRQRVALARALYGAPRLLVLDEPSAFLDAAGEAGLVRLLRDLAAAGIGVLYTSHRPAPLAAADRVLVLRGGQLLPTTRVPALAGPTAPRLAAPAGQAA